MIVCPSSFALGLSEVGYSCQSPDPPTDASVDDSKRIESVQSAKIHLLHSLVFNCITVHFPSKPRCLTYLQR